MIGIKRGDSDFQFINTDGSFSKIHDIRFVSCKVGQYIAPTERQELIELAKKYGATPMTTKKIDRKWELVKVE